ncbi:MAG TPA: exo-alpha-sialidase [Caldithrix abyssi]|uniref:exo-alpha-sialidase n=1 Tax=Caldithrix abyssi TaxID=187145 RepID=A0A7V5LIY9_CALAY|nr:exo-alpha-sialidase [Caldithrix abyssi]
MRNFLQIPLIIFLALLLGGCTTSTEPPFFEDRIVLKQKGDVGAYAIPNISITPRGTVLLFATVRMQSNVDWGNEQKVVLLRSLDDGQSWLAPQIIAAKPNWTVRGLAVIVDPQSGRIHYFGYQSPRSRPDGKPINEIFKIEHPDSMKKLGAGFFYIYSDDEGASWSEAKHIELDFWPFGTGIVLRYGKHQGRFVLPARTELKPRLDWQYMHNGVLISDDRGRSWRKGGLTQNQVGECCLVELSDGRLYVNNRNHGPDFVWRSFAISHDGGQTFTEFGVDSQLVEPVCHASLLRLTEPDEENVILFANPAVKARKTWDGASRRRMTVCLSFDDARSWTVKKLIYPGPCAYSSMAKGRNGLVFLAYERGDLGTTNSRQDIAVARFNLSWLKQPTPEPHLARPLKSIFYNTLKVNLKADAGLDIYYQKNEKEQTQLYQNALTLSKTIHLKAWFQDVQGHTSVSIELYYRKSSFCATNTAFFTRQPLRGSRSA